MKLSILVPVYNAERFLEPFLRCLAAQELSDAEVIFVDDCSTDESRRRLEGLGGLGGLEVQVIPLPRNVGVSEARQAALDAAKGEYVIFADPDDLVEPGMYRELVEVAEKTGADLVWEDFWEGGGEWTRRDCFVEDTTGEGLIRAILMGRLHGATWNKLIRRSFIEQCGARFLSGRVGMCEDVDFLCQVLMAEPKCVYHDGCHYRYRVVQGSATHFLTEGSFDSLKRVYDDLLELFSDRPELLSILSRWWKGCCLSCFMRRAVSTEYFLMYSEGVSDLVGLEVKYLWKILYWLGRHGWRDILLKFVGVI